VKDDKVQLKELKKCISILILTFFVFSFYRVLAQVEAPQLTTEPEQRTTNKYINADLFKKNDNYEIRGLAIVMEKFNYLSDYKTLKGYFYNGRVVSFRDKDLGYFAVNSLAAVICGDGFDANGNLTGGCQETPEGEVIIQLPYFPNGKYADIYDPFGKKVLTIDLTSKATCNENGKCDQPVEDSVNCPEDCKNNEPVINTQSTNLTPISADQPTTGNSAPQKIGFSPIIIIIIILILGILGVVGYYIWRKNKEYL